MFVTRFVFVFGLLFSLFGLSNASAAKPLKIAICATQGVDQLKAYAEHLENNYRVKVHLIEAEKAKSAGEGKFKPTPFSNIEKLSQCDVIVSNLYRTWAPENEMKLLKEQFLSKPVVGLRKAHHGFQNWLKIDRELFGITYGNHYYGDGIQVSIVEEQKDNPLLAGLKVIIPGGGLYKHTDPADDLTVLMIGGPKAEAQHPQCWTREIKQRKQKAVYLRYDPEDIQKEPTVANLVTKSIFWAADKKAETYAK